MEVAKKTNRQLKVFWSYDEDPTFRVRLKDLFDNDFVEVSSQDIEQMKDVELFTFKRSVTAAKKKKGLDDLEVLQKKFGINEEFIDMINSKAENLVFHYWSLDNRLPISAIDAQKNFLLLEIKKDIQDIVDRFVSQNEINKDTIGVHIRSTDFNAIHKVNYADIARKVERENNASKKIFLFSDSKNVEEKFANKFENVIIRNDKKFVKKIDEAQPWIFEGNNNRFADRDVIIDALIDLLIACKTRLAIYDTRSMFSLFILRMNEVINE
tara:strand:+ start:592 stop:1395 length:804 start_codon:yes stop_codon:yes gene_type:complete